jgi:biopolymer transport protein ExbD
MRKNREEEYLNGNLTAMIDVVFQLIIFFVCTVNLQDAGVDQSIRLAMAPHGEVVTKKNPLEIYIHVDKSGKISIARMPISEEMLYKMMKKVAGEYGADNVPIIIRGDAKTKHGEIRKAMDACARAGIWKIKIAALKEKA